MLERRVAGIEGTVQGVGFRPFVHTLAMRLGLRGLVRNESGRVVVDVEGEGAALEEFFQRLGDELPPPAAIRRVEVARADALGYAHFRIERSERQAALAASRAVAADIATCDDCARELFDPADRRYRYPFISCSRCGPRLSILLELPYDRVRTTMRGFVMCARCHQEYDNPADRRFHAQTNACATCGPQLTLRIPGSDTSGLRAPATGELALRSAVEALREGKIVAVKGIGGYHLACDATSPAAVERLRRKKGRESKPLAVMLRDMAAVHRYADASGAEPILTSTARPIVLLRTTDADPAIAPEVSTGSPWLGVMLPYTPLHHLLLHDAGVPLVMTSGNRSEEPIVTEDDEAMMRLGGIADVILAHDRRISTRCDDSVVRAVAGAATPIRRSRGFVPDAVPLPVDAPEGILALGGHLKSTVCVAGGRWAQLSPHVGDLDGVGAVDALRDTIARQLAMSGVRPTVLAHDLHPDYASTQLARRLVCGDDDLIDGPDGLRLVGVQHHHAHVAACLAEHGVTTPVLGVAFDGAGLGTDGAIWGGEFLVVNGARYTRAAHFRYVPLPGGDAAARQPWRMAAAHLWSAFGDAAAQMAPRWLDLSGRAEWPLLQQMMTRGVRTPPTSSVGRLFDAVAALTGLRLVSRFEGEAAIALEAAADSTEPCAYACELIASDTSLVVDTTPLIRRVVEDVAVGTPVPVVSARFHNGLARTIVAVALRVREESGTSCVALTGGVFQNALLTERATSALEEHGFRVLLHRRTPCNDGGLSLGQAWVGVVGQGSAERLLPPPTPAH